MPSVFPFRAVQYQQGEGDVSAFIAPPYDVLDADDKRSLLSRSDRNVVAIDLPHIPPKDLGPREAYEGAARLYRSWLSDGTLSRRSRPAMFAYRQRFEFRGGRYERCGMACTVETVPFGARPGGGILPHEQTFSGPKEDRLALMKATACQMSPIFGLHADEQGQASGLVRQVMSERRPSMTARMDDGVEHEVWTIEDERTIGAYADALAGEDVFIADGHHRYNTALNYLAWLEGSGPVPAEHPARRTMMVLVGMSDPGLAIGPTHRVLGGMSGYSWATFVRACAGVLRIREIGKDPRRIEGAMEGERGSVLGLYDVASGTCAVATLVDPDPLRRRFDDKPEAWRKLDVAITQHVIVDEICEPKLNEGKAVKWAFPHSVEEVLEIAGGAETGSGGGAGFAQLAIIVRPTPLEAVREISWANELMPQKSTYFYPKLATGLMLNPLE